jgi:hypothetical protein
MRAPLRSMGTLLCLATACSPTPVAVQAQLDENISSVVHVTWESAEAGIGWVRYTDSYGVERETPAESSPTTIHTVPVLGLLPDSVAELIAMDDSTGEPLEHESVLINIPSPTVDTPVAEATGGDEGYLLTHILTFEQYDSIVVYDRRGQPVWAFTPEEEERILSLKLQDDGSIWFASNPSDYVNTVGHAYHMRFDGSLMDIFEIDRLHSGLVPLEDGGFAYLTKQDGEFEGRTLLWDRIEERAADGTTRVVFDTRDHLDLTQLCGHQSLPIPDSDGEFFDWTHANALILSEDGTHYYLMSRFLDTLLKINRTTGELVWLLGGPYGEFSFPKTEDRFNHAHTSVVEQDRMLVFDNASHSSPRVSRAVVYTIDEKARSVSVQQEVLEPSGAYVSLLGDVKDAGEGGLLISWTMRGTVTEVNADGEEVWRLKLPGLMASGRSTWMTSFP